MGKVVKTDKQRNSEIAALEAIQPKVRPMSIFGDDNRQAIGAEINVLQKMMTNEQIHSRYGTEYIRDSALFARQWLEGEVDEGLADEWKLLTE